MEGVSEELCIFFLGRPDAISLRFGNILHVPRFDDEESFLDGCLHIRVSEYALNTRMLSFGNKTMRWTVIISIWVTQKSIYSCRAFVEYPQNSSLSKMLIIPEEHSLDLPVTAKCST